MPLSRRGKKIKRRMEQEYGTKKGDQVFYAKENKERRFRRRVRRG
jgi:hypothetical protein